MSDPDRKKTSYRSNREVAEKSVEDEEFLAAMSKMDLEASAGIGRSPEVESSQEGHENMLNDEDRVFIAAMAADDGPEPSDRESPETAEKRNPYHGTLQTLHRRIRHGEIEASRTLDLHGMRRDEARTALQAFIRTTHREGSPLIRIICGRGHHSKHEAVLAKWVPRWLEEDMGERVIRTIPAPRGLGGRGALYVFLRQSD